LNKFNKNDKNVFTSTVRDSGPECEIFGTPFRKDSREAVSHRVGIAKIVQGTGTKRYVIVYPSEKVLPRLAMPTPALLR